MNALATTNAWMRPRLPQIRWTLRRGRTGRSVWSARPARRTARRGATGPDRWPGGGLARLGTSPL